MEKQILRISFDSESERSTKRGASQLRQHWTKAVKEMQMKILRS